MYFDLRWILFSIINIFAMLFLQMVNSFLAPHAVYLFILGPYLLIPSLYLKIKASLTCAVISCFFWSAALPLEAAFAFPLIVLIHLGLFLYRSQIVIESTYQLCVLACIINLIFYIYLIFWANTNLLHHSSLLWSRLFFDGLLSTLATIPITIWLKKLNNNLLNLLNINYDPDYTVR